MYSTGMNKLILTVILALVLVVPANVLAQPTANQTRYVPMMLDTECFFYGTGCDQFEQDPSGLHYYDTQTGKIFKYKPINDLPLCSDPYYVTGRLGSTCYDDGDPTDPLTNSSLVPPREPTDPEEGARPICTPDGPECPPCPEGVEAGWCQDEDERQDIDDESEGGSDGGDGSGGDGGDGVDPFEGLKPLGEEENENKPPREAEPVID